MKIDDFKGTESILVVDDIPEQRDMAAGMLSKLGYQVKTVDSGEAAIAHVNNQPVDIIILDMIMEPGIDGCETYRRIAVQYPKQKAIIASGFSKSQKVKEVQKLGAGSYVRKPCTMDKIAAAVRIELDR